MAMFVQGGSKKSSAVVCAFQNATKPLITALQVFEAIITVVEGLYYSTVAHRLTSNVKLRIV